MGAIFNTKKGLIINEQKFLFAFMKMNFKIYRDWELGLYKFKGNIELEDILSIVKESYSNKDFINLKCTILDFRECSFGFDLPGLKEIIKLVEVNKNVTMNVKAGLLVGEPKVTALSSFFATHLGIKKQVKVISTLSHLIESYDLSISEPELDKLLTEVL